MAVRRALVIGSQCQGLPNSPLPFLPTYAEQLYEVLIDPHLGACNPALPGNGLIINPTLNEMAASIKTAVMHASDDEATLFVAFIGHAVSADNDLYLLPWNGIEQPDMDSGYLVGQRLAELFRRYRFFDGLLLMLDACHAGVAITGAPPGWLRHLAEAQTRFEILTAVNDRPAADGCFTNTIVRIASSGDPKYPLDYLGAGYLRDAVADACSRQQPPNWLVLHSGRPGLGDPGLWLARNTMVNRQQPLSGTPAAGQAAELARWLQVTSQLAELVQRSWRERCVAVIGPAGSGKSTLMAALAWPEAGEEIVPARFVHALAFASLGPTPPELAGLLAEQLNRTVDGFTGAAIQARNSMPQEDWTHHDAFEQQLIEPLRRLHQQQPAGKPIRIVIDGLDQLRDDSYRALLLSLDQLVSEPLSRVRLIVTSRDDDRLPKVCQRLRLTAANDVEIYGYLQQRRLPAGLHAVVARLSSGNWLLISLLADIAGAGGLDPERLPQTLADVYDHELRRAGIEDVQDDQLGPLLTVLAVSRAGPVLPLALLAKASAQLGGPDQPARVRDSLVRLTGLVVRGQPGTDAEQVGLFHETLNEHLATGSAFAVNPRGGHAALVEAIAQLAPAHTHNPTDPLHEYAAAAEANHLWQLGRYKDALEVVEHREPYQPVENLRVWGDWQLKAIATLGPHHPETLTARQNMALWVGEAGELARALQLLQELLPDQERILGPDHPDTLATRHNIASYGGQAGDLTGAVQLLQELLPDQQRIQGPDHPDTLATRGEIAFWIGKSGNAVRAVQLLQELLPDQQRIQGPDHLRLLTTRHNIAFWTGETGDGTRALQLYRELVPDQERVLGPGHPGTLTTRNNIAFWTGQSGDAAEALRLYRKLLSDRERFLGPDHPGTLIARGNIAFWTGESGDPVRALQLFQELLPDQQRILGSDHPETLTTRSNIATRTWQAGETTQGFHLLLELLSDQEHVLGPNHPDTLKTRRNIARLTRESGDAPKALRLARELLPDQERVLGPDHPDTLETRSNIASWTGKTGDATRALRLHRKLLPRKEHVLGADHRETLTTRSNIAFWTGQTGDAARAVKLFRKLLADQERVLGTDHIDTVATRANIAFWTGETGDTATAVQLFRELLPDQERILGPDHPNTVASRKYITYGTGRTGGVTEAP
jgi:tetratricopeptide (TPR) repeat protein